MEPWELDVAAMTAAYRDGDLRPSEVLASVFDRIEEVDGEIGAFRQVLFDEALTAAERSDRMVLTDSRPLEGVPVAIKELFDVAGADGSYGSEVLAGRVADSDAEAVRRLRAAGAVIVGTTRSHEFGWGITTQNASLGSTVNPWDPSRIPGGSSGGSAAAVASGMVPISLGSDTGGSIRIPAAFCGVVGFKPTYGRVPKRGAVALAPSLDHPGPLARTTTDAAVVLRVLAGSDPTDPSTWRAEIEDQPSLIRLGVCPELHEVALSDSYANLFETTIARLEGFGLEVVEVRLPEAADIRPTFNAIQMAEAYHYHSRVLGTYPDRAALYGPDVRHRLELGSAIELADYLDARQMVSVLEVAFGRLFAEIDVLLTPVSAGGPSFRNSADSVEHRGTEMPLRDLVMGYTVPQNLFGLPAVTVPVGTDENGMPVGMQFTAAQNNEWAAANAAAHATVELGWPTSGS